MMDFGIGVIVYNPDEDVFKRLVGYQKLTEYLIIFDNSEEDNAVSAHIREKFGEYYFHEDNVGMSGALNKLFKISLDLRLDVLLTMDQDSDFSNENITSVLDIIKNENDSEIAIYCPNYRKAYVDTESGNISFGNYKIDNDVAMDVNYSMTSGSFYKVPVLKNILPLDNLFIGYVDQDICYNLRLQGYKIRMLGWIGFDQRVGETLPDNWYNKLIRGVRQTELRYIYMGRNNFFLRAKYKGNHEIVFDLKKNYLRLILNIVLSENRKLDKYRSLLRGKRLGKVKMLGNYTNIEKEL